MTTMEISFIRTIMALALSGILHCSTGPLHAADELLTHNADFEEWNQQTLFPNKWMEDSSYKAKIRIITHEKDVHDGEGCVLVENDDPVHKVGAILYGIRIPVLSDHKYYFKIWARGTGKIMLHLYQYGAKDEFIVPKSNANSKFYELTDNWEEYSFDYSARPEDQVIKLVPAIHVTDQAYLDDASLIEGEAVKSN